MKYIIVITLLLTCTLVKSQHKFQHEKEINNKEKYLYTNIDFVNNDAYIVLSGTLISPKSAYDKIVVIIPGSGKDTRFAHHKLTEAFLQKNIAVYRFDERGVGRSEGRYTPTISNLSNDLSYCINNLKSTFKKKQIGVLGHSLGAMAAVIAIDKNETDIDFLIQLATPVKNFAEASKYQIKTLPLYKVANKSTLKTTQLLDTLIQITQKGKELRQNNQQIRNNGIKAIKKKNFQLKNIKFWSYVHIDLFKQDYETVYKKLQIPTMYVIGSKDKFVNPITETRHLKKYNNPLVTIKVMKNLNHYLTTGTLESTDIYNIDKRATDVIMNWVLKI